MARSALYQFGRAPVMHKDACIIASRHYDVAGRICVRHRVDVILVAQRSQHGAARRQVIHDDAWLGGPGSNL